MKVAKTTIRFLDEYLRFIEKITTQEDLIFRGQSQDYTLLPKIGRKNLLFDPMEKRGALERKIFDEFKRMACSYEECIHINNDLDWLAIAQHYGLPTRLLDWTTNALAALWFAVETDGSNKESGYVYIYRPNPDDFYPVDALHNPLAIENLNFINPRYTNKRLIAQSGIFSIHNHIESSDSFIRFDANKNLSGDFFKIEIPSSQKFVLRYDVDRCGINRKALFPDLDGLCQHLSWLYFLMPDEVGKKRSEVVRS